MFKKIASLFMALVAAFALSACGDEKVSHDRLEETRQTAKANAEFNAALYKAQNPRFTSDFAIVSRSDDSQTATCPQGDGWAELSIMRAEGKVVDKTVLMCSTYSSSVGCYRKEDFDKNANLARQNGSCNPDVPNPLPKIGK